MSDFFLRNAYVVIVPKGSSKGIQLGGDPLNPFKIKFNIDKYSQSGEGGSARIDLYNLDPTTIATIRANGTSIRLNAGYGMDTPILAFGTVYNAPMSLAGSDQVINIEMIESGLVLDQTKVNFGLGPNSTNQQALNLVLNQLYAAGLIKGNVVPLSPVQTFNKGIHFCGMAKTILYRLCHTVNYTFSISNGDINIGPRGVNQGPKVFLLSPTTGLIDIPSPDVESFGDYTPFKLKSLLNPRLLPQGIVKVQSKYVKNGFYKIFSVKHSGDTLEGNEYWSTIQAYFVGN